MKRKAALRMDLACLAHSILILCTQINLITCLQTAITYGLSVSHLFFGRCFFCPSSRCYQCFWKGVRVSGICVQKWSQKKSPDRVRSTLEVLLYRGFRALTSCYYEFRRYKSWSIHAVYINKSSDRATTQYSNAWGYLLVNCQMFSRAVHSLSWLPVTAITCKNKTNYRIFYEKNNKTIIWIFKFNWLSISLQKQMPVTRGKETAHIII